MNIQCHGRRAMHAVVLKKEYKNGKRENLSKVAQDVELAVYMKYLCSGNPTTKYNASYYTSKGIFNMARRIFALHWISKSPKR